MNNVRPTGKGQIKAGWWVTAVSLLLGLISLGTSDISSSAALGQLSTGALGTAMVLFATGWIIGAIYFLPCRDDMIAVSSGIDLTSGAPQSEPPRYASSPITPFSAMVGSDATLPAAPMAADEELALTEQPNDWRFIIWVGIAALFLILFAVVSHKP